MLASLRQVPSGRPIGSWWATIRSTSAASLSSSTPVTTTATGSLRCCSGTAHTTRTVHPLLRPISQTVGLLVDLPLGPTAPNMRLKLAGDDRFKGSGVLCASPFLSHHRASESHETSHWHRRHLLQGQARSVTAGLVPAALGNRGPSLGRSCLRLDRLRGQAGCRHNCLANQSARK